MPQSLDPKFYIIPFLVLATFGLLHTKKANYNPHTKIKLYVMVIYLYLGSVYTFAMALIDAKLFGKITVFTGVICILFIFLTPNKWLDKKYNKWKENRLR